MNRRPLLLLVLAVVAGLLGYGVTRLALRTPAAELSSADAQLDWLAREFKLDAAVRAEVARLQADYEPICEAHCAAIADAQAALRRSGPNDPAARSLAEAEIERLKQVCAESTQAHLRSVAALMTPDQAARFLAMMQPHVAHQDDRAGAPALAPTLAR